jgi:catechol 2,3-dioxygenase-like lactoylglutathione lyase family enzyme
VRPLFVGAVGVITGRLKEGRSLYVNAIGLPLSQAEGTNFLHSTRLGGGRYFGVWPLAEAARTCFGRSRWPKGRPIPQAFIEFEVASPAAVTSAAAELESKGYALLHGPRTDPWGQTVVRFQTNEGLVVGISYVPWMHHRPKGKKRRSRARRR